MNYNKLKGKIAENKLTYVICANHLNISVTAFANKMRGISKFTVPEANNLAVILNLSNMEKISIFFS